MNQGSKGDSPKSGGRGEESSTYMWSAGSVREVGGVYRMRGFVSGFVSISSSDQAIARKSRWFKVQRLPRLMMSAATAACPLANAHQAT